jgi:hypothetical protein
LGHAITPIALNLSFSSTSPSIHTLLSYLMKTFPPSGLASSRLGSMTATQQLPQLAASARERDD